MHEANEILAQFARRKRTIGVGLARKQGVFAAADGGRVPFLDHCVAQRMRRRTELAGDGDERSVVKVDLDILCVLEGINTRQYDAMKHDDMF